MVPVQILQQENCKAAVTALYTLVLQNKNYMVSNISLETDYSEEPFQDRRALADKVVRPASYLPAVGRLLAKLNLHYSKKIYSYFFQTGTGAYRSCTALFTISNPLRYMVKSSLVWLVLVWFGLVDFCWFE